MSLFGLKSDRFEILTKGETDDSLIGMLYEWHKNVSVPELLRSSRNWPTRVYTLHSYTDFHLLRLMPIFAFGYHNRSGKKA